MTGIAEHFHAIALLQYPVAVRMNARNIPYIFLFGEPRGLVGDRTQGFPPSLQCPLIT